MNLKNKKNQLINLLNGYIVGNVSHNELQSFAWEIIDFFSSRNASELPNWQPWEKEFWFSIWQIVHLADQEHEEEGLTMKELKNSLSYLKGETKIPESYVGKRP